MKKRRITLIAVSLGILGSALMAGVSLAYAIAVMPGLAAGDDPSFAQAFYAVDRSLDDTVWFWIVVFVGTLVAIAVASFLAWRAGRRSALPVVAGGLVLYLLVVGVTAFGLDPLEGDFADAFAGSAQNASAALAALDVDQWSALNLVRLVAALGASAVLIWSVTRLARDTAV